MNFNLKVSFLKLTVVFSSFQWCQDVTSFSLTWASRTNEIANVCSRPAEVEANDISSCWTRCHIRFRLFCQQKCCVSVFSLYQFCKHEPHTSENWTTTGENVFGLTKNLRYLISSKGVNLKHYLSTYDDVFCHSINKKLKI